MRAAECPPSPDIARSPMVSGVICKEPRVPSPAREGHTVPRVPGSVGLGLDLLPPAEKMPLVKSCCLNPRLHLCCSGCWCSGMFHAAAKHNSLREMPQLLVIAAALALHGSKGWGSVICYFKAARSFKLHIHVHLCVCVSEYMYVCFMCT